MDNIILLSKNFSLAEALFSSTAERFGIDNSHPSEQIIARARNTAVMMERVRAIFGNVPLHIDSWIRCLELNRKLGSSDNSQHILGEAVDFICPCYGTPLEIIKHILNNGQYVDFDQLIYEHSWVHISHSSSGAQRRHVLTLHVDRNTGKSSYLNGIVVE